ncbi:GGDEF domain-containing protein [Chitinibacter fontanus]|uniref:diguanylate cyclase n=1 Tax=Chitinibacter fontanus TaxID=1737446 RepID=A0A7D5ZD26_9NEIS|nr:GGDEF domain-containing protein [Chitinibacter fontanus]QLI80268.1 GGDEF domain-containing protein [Chitinibacter fontanus]
MWSKEAFRAVRWSIALITFILVVLQCALHVNLLLKNRELTEKSTVRDMHNLAKAVAEQADGTFGSAENLLFGAEKIVRELGHQPEIADATKLKTELKGMQSLHGIFLSTFVVNRDGLLLSVSDRDVKPINVADRNYFITHHDRTTSVTLIENPFVSRASGIWSTTMTRGVYDSKHQFLGVVGVALRVPYFVNFYSKLDLGLDSSVVLIRADGQILARYPFIESAMTTRLDEASKELAKSGNNIGSFKAKSPFDGIDRRVVVKRLNNYPVAAVISVSQKRILEGWYETLALHVVLLCVGSLCSLGAGALLWFQLIAIEQRTAESLFDELTGLPNRRAFEHHLIQEARRALRSGRTLCLLMIDVDNFKRYNDVKGHGAGDQCLRIVASALAERINRPGDMVTRWGGEEFCCILPESDEAGALSMANSMLNAVRQQNIAHPDSAYVTISVGCALATLEELSSIAGLKERADAALYEAKRLGRDRCVVSTKTKCMENI